MEIYRKKRITESGITIVRYFQPARLLASSCGAGLAAKGAVMETQRVQQKLIVLNGDGIIDARNGSDMSVGRPIVAQPGREWQ